MCNSLNPSAISTRSRRIPTLTLVLTLAGSLSGCGGGPSLDAAFKKIFEPRRTPQQYMILAVSDADADVRRASVAKIAGSKERNKEWAIRGYIAIALLEDDPQARCVAIRALAATRDPRAAPTLLKLLNYKDHPPAEVRPPDNATRWDAVLSLAGLSDSAVPEDARELAQKTLIDHLKLDSDRLVRGAAARGLGYYSGDESFSALIDGLRDEDYSVVHECESSLVRLTGVTNYASYAGWKKWAADHAEAPFADAGTVPASRRKPYSTRWGKFVFDARQTFRYWLLPDKKESPARTDEQ